MRFHQPPKTPLRLLRWFCSDERIEELEGDLCEVFNERIGEKGTRFSSMFYWWIVIGSFRKYAFKKTKQDRGITSWWGQLSHNLLMARRSMWKYKTTTSINIFGLAIGISAFLVLFRIVSYELSFNQHFPNKERVFRLYSQFSGALTGSNRGVAAGVPDEFRSMVSGVDLTTHFHTFSVGQVKIAKKDKHEVFSPKPVVLADSSFFLMFDQYTWLEGSTSSSLSNPFQVVLTKERAKEYFPNLDPADIIGRSVFYRDSLETFVSAIVDASEANTDFQFSDFVSLSTIKSPIINKSFETGMSSTNGSSQFWVRLSSGTNPEDLKSQLEKLNERVHELTQNKNWSRSYELQPLSDLHYNPKLGIFDYSLSEVANLNAIYLLAFLGGILLLIAIFNFINLETAQSITKSKESGIRKTIGSTQGQLISRFLSESILTSFIAVFLAIPIAQLMMTQFADFIPDAITLELSNPDLWGFIIVVAFGIGILSGIYPAFVLSAEQPVKAIKSNTGKLGLRHNLLRKSLITSQFVFAQFLIIGTLAIALQIDFLMSRDLGFESDEIISIYTPWFSDLEDQDVFVNELSGVPGVSSMVISQNPPAYSGWSTTTLDHIENEVKTSVQTHIRRGEEHFLDFYDIEIIAGRTVNKGNEDEILINLTCAKKLGFHNPTEAIGANLSGGQKVVGIMEDINFQSLHQGIEPMMFTYGKDGACISLKINMATGIKPVIDEIDQAWQKVYPNETLEVDFLNETIASFYEEERRMAKLATAAMVMAIIISCLGLFGLVSFTITNRSKEIGIRKVLGASILHISHILTREFIVLICLALLIAIPAAYYILNDWISDFAYQIKLSWWIFISGGAISIVTAALVIGSKILNASRSNPVESLRYE